MQDLDAATIDDVREFYHAYYVPNNATIAMAGDLKSDEAVAWIRKYFDHIPKSQTPIVRQDAKEPPQEKEHRVLQTKAVPLPAYVAGYHVPADGDPDYYPLVLASSILSDGRSSRIYKSLVYEKRLALEADASGNFTEDPNLFFATLIMNQGVSVEAGEKALNAELMRLMMEAVTDKELAKAKNKMRAEYAFSRPSVQEEARAVAQPE